MTDSKASTRYGIKQFFLSALILFIFCFMSGCSQPTQNNDPPNTLPSYGVFIGVDSDQLQRFADYDIVVIDAAYYSKEDIDIIHQNNTIVYSYLNLGSLEDFRDFFEDFKHLSLGEYDDWPGEYWVDVSNAGWQNHIHAQAGLLIEKGVDGFFIDNTDVYYLYQTQSIFEGVVAILNKLAEYDKDIILNGGDVFVTDAIIKPDSPLVQITGVNQECVFTSIDFDNQLLIPQTEEDTIYYQDYLAQCKNKGLVVYLLEYSDNNDSFDAIKEYCDLHSFNYYISSSIDLQ